MPEVAELSTLMWLVSDGRPPEYPTCTLILVYVVRSDVFAVTDVNVLLEGSVV